MRIAFFSDVHSNLPALEAVLADMAAAGERLRAEGIPSGDKPVEVPA